MFISCPQCRRGLNLSHGIGNPVIVCPNCHLKFSLADVTGKSAPVDPPEHVAPGPLLLPTKPLPPPARAVAAGPVRHGAGIAIALLLAAVAGGLTGLCRCSNQAPTQVLDFRYDLYPKGVGENYRPLSTPESLATMATMPDVIEIAGMRHDEQERRRIETEKAAQKALADLAAKEKQQQAASLEEARQRQQQLEAEAARQAEASEERRRKAAEFDVAMKQVTATQEAMFRERERIRARAAAIKRDYISAFAELQQFNAMAAPYYNLNPAETWRQYGAAPFPRVTIWGPPINYVAPVTRLSEASDKYAFIVGGRARAMTTMVGIQQQMTGVAGEMESLNARAEQLRTECQALEKTRPPGAVAQPLPPR
jgi:hypothetical protein